MSEILVLPNLSYTSFEESFSEPPSLERHQCSWQSCSRPTEQCQETVFVLCTHMCVHAFKLLEAGEGPSAQHSQHRAPRIWNL